MTLPDDDPDDADEPSDADDPPDTFEQAVEAAIAAIPAPFSAHLGSVAIVIEDEPSTGQLAEARVHGLYGLYQGVPRTIYGADQAAVPSKITLFRGPLERDHRGTALEAAVRETVFHEVAHHLGISDARLHELWGAERRGHR